MKKISLTEKDLFKDLLITTDSDIKGIFKGNGSSVIKGRFNIVHNQADLKSRVHIKVVLFEHDVLDIEPQIVINRGSKGCDTYLKIDVLLVGEKAQARVVPSLEIMENEVKGGHGATISRISQDHLYYLQSRGLDIKTATQVLISAFLEEFDHE
jgi:Fe-S cluster assembly protein SufD